MYQAGTSKQSCGGCGDLPLGHPVAENRADSWLRGATHIAPRHRASYPPPPIHPPQSGTQQGAVMGRAIVSVVVGYVAMFAAIFLSFSALYLALGQETSFRPGTYEPSVLWTVVSFVLGGLSAILG